MEGHTELELKYDVDAGFVPPDLTGVPGCAGVADPHTSTLDARYFDTDDLRLVRRRVTLRRREGGDDAGWHLKLPLAGNAKREIQLPLDAGERDVPADLAGLVAAHARGRPLEPVVRLETRRVERRILGADGRVLAVLAHDDVRAQRLGRDGGPLRLMSWQEIEVEAVDGSPAFLEAVGERLRAHGAREAVTASKLARALAEDLTRGGTAGDGSGATVSASGGVAAGAETTAGVTDASGAGDAAGPAESRAESRFAESRTAGEMLLAALREHADDMLARDPLVRLADHDDDSVHTMRVAVRRLRSLLRTHRPLVQRAPGTGLDWELRWLAGELGRVRDLEVLAARLDRELADLPGARHRPALLGELAVEEQAARAELRQTLAGRRYFDLLDTLDAFLAAPPFTERAGRPAGQETRALVARAYRKAVRRLADAERRPRGHARDTTLHSARKIAKRARYTAEAATGLLGPAAKEAGRRAKRVQQVLGDHQDAVLAAERVATAAHRPGTSAADAFVLGRLAELERHGKADALRALPAAARQIRKRKVLKALARQ